MKQKGRHDRKSSDERRKVPRLAPIGEGLVRLAEWLGPSGGGRNGLEDGVQRNTPCATAIAAEALRTGVLPGARPGRREPIPREAETIRVGDPDDRVLANEYGGEETPGGSSSTPDQSVVDEIGRAYGLQEEDSGCLRSAAEVLERRDRRRFELQPPPRRWQ